MIRLIVWMTILVFTRAAEASIKINTFNLASKQIQNLGMSTHEVSLLKSMQKFCGTDSFDKNIEEISKSFTKEKIISAAEKIANSIKEGSEKISKDLILKENLSLNVFLAIGCGKTDAFAIPYDGKYAVFFDLTTLLSQKREDAPLVFIAHEIMHGIHFSLQPEFSPENYKSAEDNLIRYMLAEGMATYTAALITKADERTALWVDILDEKKYDEYIRTATADLPRFSKRIKSYLKDPTSEPKLLNDLFYVLSTEHLETKRMGYFYAYSILKSSSNHPMNQLRLNYPAIKKEVLEYFNLR